jgi:hypothetical protein
MPTDYQPTRYRIERMKAAIRRMHVRRNKGGGTTSKPLFVPRIAKVRIEPTTLYREV